MRDTLDTPKHKTMADLMKQLEDLQSPATMPLPTVRAKRWWWPPDRKRAKLATKIVRYSLTHWEENNG